MPYLKHGRNRHQFAVWSKHPDDNGLATIVAVTSPKQDLHAVCIFAECGWQQGEQLFSHTNRLLV